jgi:hypothetical protein
MSPRWGSHAGVEAVGCATISAHDEAGALPLDVGGGARGGAAEAEGAVVIVRVWRTNAAATGAIRAGQMDDARAAGRRSGEEKRSANAEVRRASIASASTAVAGGAGSASYGREEGE